MASTAELETVSLSNGLTCEVPSDSPLGKLLKSQRTWVGPNAKERLGILRSAHYTGEKQSEKQTACHN